MKFSAALCLSAVAAFAQAPAPRLAFEVATIKPAQPPNPADIMSGKMRVGMAVNGSRVDIGFFSLEDLIRTAYKVKAYQISGPKFLSTERFDIQAKMPDGANKDQVPEMLQALLADRFKIEVHHDSKEESVYEMVVAKSGLKIKESEPDSPTPPTGAGDGGPSVQTNNLSFSQDSKGVVVRSGGEGGTSRMTMSNGMMHLEMKKLPISRLAEMLGRFVDRPIVDKTGLTANYDVALDVSMEEIMKMARQAGMAVPMGPGGGGGDASKPADAASDPSGASIFATIQQLGLKLEPKKGAIERLIVDHIEKAPTEN